MDGRLIREAASGVSLQQYALKLMELRKGIEDEMKRATPDTTRAEDERH